MSQTSLNGILSGVWRTIGSALLGCILLALVISVCFQLHTRLGIVALFCLLTIVILSLHGRFFVALFCSMLATLGLDYFFTQPVFSLAVTRPEDIAALLTFITIALVVGALGSNLRKSYWKLAQENTERKRAEKQLHEKEVSLREAQSRLANVSQLTMMGELAVSIAHEVNQPLTAILNNANACLSLLPSETKDLGELRAALSDIVSDAHRASAVIARIRGLAEKVPPQKSRLNINETIEEVIALARGELNRNGVLLQTGLANDLPPILGDRIQLQQVLLNLIINAIDAMSGMAEGSRELRISSAIGSGAACAGSRSLSGPADAGEQTRIPELETQPVLQSLGEGGNSEPAHVLVSVADSGPGLDPKHLNRLFDAFYTTKSRGLGMGLAISRSIVEAHRGPLWAMASMPRGALFQFTLPLGAE